MIGLSPPSPFKNNQFYKCLTDHKSILMDFSKGEKRENMKQATKKSLWQYDTENGDDTAS